ncbi:hypothetical protein RF11_14207 [Thelohanellus kitauei]|uniref:Integrin beta n=1 Tax=Thelohanellus kitauei TaxID=669202 RepID=A0A0C2MXG2_THEKT|nr:hypothetical protein RF11_14207 [Thelohanellus kitauei]
MARCSYIESRAILIEVRKGEISQAREFMLDCCHKNFPVTDHQGCDSKTRLMLPCVKWLAGKYLTAEPNNALDEPECLLDAMLQIKLDHENSSMHLMIVITESGSKRAGHGDDYIHPHILGESLSNNNIRVLFLIQPSKLEHYKILSESFKQQVVGIVDYSSITAVSLNTTIHRADRQGRMIKFNLDHLKSKFDTKTYITWYVLKSRKSAKKRGLIHRNIILKESEEKCNSHGQLICGKCDCDSGWYIDSNSGKEIHASVKRGKYLIVTKKWNVKSTTIVGSMASVYEANTPEQFNGPGCVCSDLNCPNTQNGLCICYYIYFATLKVLANAENVFGTSTFREMIAHRSQNVIQSMRINANALISLR